MPNVTEQDKTRLIHLLRIQATGLRQIADELEQGTEVSIWMVDFDMRDYELEISQFKERGVVS